MTKKEIETRLRDRFATLHWISMLIDSRAKAFMRTDVVTPFFYPRIIRRAEHVYLIDGYIGCLHRGFEKSWAVNQPKDTHFPCIALHIANIESLKDLRYIDEQENYSVVDMFCIRIAELLEELPQDFSTLSRAVMAETMLGLPMVKFVMYGYEKKFQSLKSFLARKSDSKKIQ